MLGGCPCRFGAFARLGHGLGHFCGILSSAFAVFPPFVLLLEALLYCSQALHYCAHFLTECLRFALGKDGESCLGRIFRGCAAVCIAVFVDHLRWIPQLFIVLFWKRSEEHPSVMHAAAMRMGDWVPLPLLLLRMLVFFFPRGLTMRGSTGKTPLHALLGLLGRGLKYDSSSYFEKYGGRLLAAVNLLVRKGPEALAVADNRGYLPLHTALAERYRLYPSDLKFEIVKILLEGFQEGAQFPVSSGKSVLEIGLEHANGEGVIGMFLNAFPKAVTKRNSQGQFPHETFAHFKNSLKNRFDCLIREELATLFAFYHLEGGLNLHILEFAEISQATSLDCRDINFENATSLATGIKTNYGSTDSR